MTRRIVRIAAALLAAAATQGIAWAQTPAVQPTAPARPPQCFALLVAGQNGSSVFARRNHDWLRRFHAVLAGAGVPAANIVTLAGDKDFKDPVVGGTASVASIASAFATMAGKVAAGDSFILFLVGHGVTTEPVPTLVLDGDDITAEQLGNGLKEIKAANALVLNFSGCGGTSAEWLAAPGRVLVSALSTGQSGEPVFAEFFLRGLESRRADGEGSAKDGTVTVLEAFNWATYQTSLWIARIRQAGNDQWRVDGKESVEIFHKLYDGPAGTEGARALHPSSDAGKPDAITVFGPPGGVVTPEWKGRRVVNELAALTDAGDGAASPLSAKGYEPLTGAKDGEPGSLARRLVIGRPPLPDSPR